MPLPQAGSNLPEAVSDTALASQPCYPDAARIVSSVTAKYAKEETNHPCNSYSVPTACKLNKDTHDYGVEAAL